MYIKRLTYLVIAVSINLLLLTTISVVGTSRKTPETPKYEVISASLFHLNTAKYIQQKSFFKPDFIDKQENPAQQAETIRTKKRFDAESLKTVSKQRNNITKADNSTILIDQTTNKKPERVNNTNELAASENREGNNAENLQMSQPNNSISGAGINTSPSSLGATTQAENRNTEINNTDNADKGKVKHDEVSSHNRNQLQTQPEIIDNPTDIGIETKEIKRVQPAYPQLALKAGIQTVVIVKVLIGVDGKVEKVEFVKSSAKFGFDDAVREALKGWEFEPITYKGRPVKVWSGNIPFKFSIK